MLSIRYIAGFGNFRPEENWQCIDFDPFYTVSYRRCLLYCHLHIEPRGVEETKLCLDCSGHMTNMATHPDMVKTLTNLLSRINWLMALKLDM